MTTKSPGTTAEVQPDPENPGPAMPGEPIPPPGTPPQKSTAKKSTTAKKAGPAPRKAATTPKRPVGRPPRPRIGAKVTESFESIGAILVMVGETREDEHLTYDGQVLAGRAAAIGASVEHIADQNPAIKRALERFFTISGWGQIAATVATVAVPIAACHGFLPTAAALPFVNAEIGLPPPPKARPEPPSSDGPRAPHRGTTDGAPASARPAASTNGGPVPPPTHRVDLGPDPIDPDDLPGWPAGTPIPE